MYAVIGGSGFEKFDAVKKIADIDRETPFGLASSGIKQVSVATASGEKKILFVSRHGEHHELLPSEVNYRANIFALKRAGATKVLAFSAVGSLREELAPGDLVVPHQYIDRTKSLRRTTFCGDGVVGHVSLANPIWKSAASALQKISANFDFPLHFQKTYVCVEGPTFSTKAESHWYRAMNADIIGMTGYPEFALAREAGLCYLPCCFVTDYDCWNEAIAHVTLEAVLEIMRQNNRKAFAILSTLLATDIAEDEACRGGGLRTGLMSPIENLDVEQRAWLEILQA